TQNHRVFFASNSAGGKTPPAHLRLVMVGAQWSAKSSAGNTILRKKAFRRRTGKCVKHGGYFGRINVAVVETPGWPADTMAPVWLKEEVLHSVSMCAPGPHVFLLVVPISKAFTEEDHKALVELLMPFGERVWRHCMVLFTWGDWLNDRLIEEHIAGEGKSLQWLVEKCGYRYHVLNCHGLSNHLLIEELFRKIIDMITRNKGQCFTSVLTEEEWNRREQELIDRMLRAVANEPEEPTQPITHIDKYILKMQLIKCVYLKDCKFTVSLVCWKSTSH
uniref:AIG1-type G domain-containing protein n=1 Tax=Oreochromis niloticus TaxID=8128 RepID=I3J1H0_ORENI